MRLVLLCLLASACSSPPVKAAESAGLDCGKVDFINLVGTAGEDLGHESYSAELDQLKTVVEKDAVDCAVKAVVAAVGATQRGLEAPAVVTRGSQYIAAVRFK